MVAIKREKDKNKVNSINQELRDFKEKRDSLYAQWRKEKDVVDSVQQSKSEKPQQLNDKALKILANSIYKSLKNEGCHNNDIIGVSRQLIGIVASSIKKKEKT